MQFLDEDKGDRVKKNGLWSWAALFMAYYDKVIYIWIAQYQVFFLFLPKRKTRKRNFLIESMRFSQCNDETSADDKLATKQL